MKFNKFYVSALLGWATLMLTHACATDDLQMPATSDAHDDVLRFCVSVAGTGTAKSRDGYDDKDQGQITYHEPHTENGSYNETALTNVLMVIYDTPLNVASSSQPGRVVKTLYIPNIGGGTIEDNHTHDAVVFNADGTSTTVVQKDVPIARTYMVQYNDLQGFDQLFLGDNATREYYAIALANVGDLSNPNVANAANSATISTSMSVLQLRDYVYNGPLFQEPAGGLFKIQGTEMYNTPEGVTSHPTYGDIISVTNCTNFAMSGMNEITVTAPTVTVEDNLGDDHHKKTTTTLDLTTKPMLVQRLAARVDISFGIQAVWSDDWYRSGDNAGQWTGDGNTHYFTDTKKYLGYGTPNGPAGKKEDVPTIYSVSGGPNELNIGDYYYPYDMDVWGHAGLYRFPVYDEAVYQATGKFRRLTDVTFYMEDIELENVVTKGSYMFERSTGSPSYLGNAGKWENNYPTNFVPSVSSRTIQDRLTMANGDYDEDGSAGRRYYEYAKDNGNFVYDDNHNPIVSKTVYPSVDNIPMPVTLIMSAHRWEGKGQYIRFSTLAYIGENTYADPNNGDNKYTTMRLSGYANFHDMHFDGVEDHENDANATDVGNANANRVAMTVTYKLRHSFGKPNPNHRMCFGVVRNTVYRTFIQFFYTGSNLVAREWYYDSVDGVYKDETYPVNIYNHVVDDPDPNHQGNPPANT